MFDEVGNDSEPFLPPSPRIVANIISKLLEESGFLFGIER